MVKTNIAIENARIGFRNFGGNAGKFNPAGRKNFCVFLEHELAEVLVQDGWNIRYLTPKDDDEKPQPYMQVAVSYENIAPKIVLVTSKGKTILNDETVNILDWAEIDSVDLIIRPYNWEVRGTAGVKAYVKSMYVTLVEDEFESKYYDVPDSAQGAVGGCGNCSACDGSCGCHDN